MELNVTFFIQLGAFLLSVLLLSTVAFGPILKTLEERSKRIDGAREEAARLGSAAGKEAHTIERRLSEARTAGQEALSKLKLEAEKKEADALTQARADANKQVDDARKALQTASAAARESLGKEAASLADAIAFKVLGRKA